MGTGGGPERSCEIVMHVMEGTVMHVMEGTVMHVMEGTVIHERSWKAVVNH